MRRDVGDRHARKDSPVIRQEADPALGRFSAAVNELGRLTDTRLLAAIERLLGDIGDVTEYTSGEAEAVHTLRAWRADYLRLTTELDAAARSLHLVEQRLGQQIDMVIADWERRFKLAAPGTAEVSAARRGRFRGLLRRSRAPTARPAGPPLEQLEPTSDGQMAHRIQAPAPGAYDADIVASVLGPMELTVAGARIPRWGSLKARSIFQYLLIHQGRPIRREVLMELEWPDHSHNSARNNLNVALYSLRNTLDRKGLAERVIVHKDGCYLLNPALTCWIDRNEFLSLIQDARRARGEGSSQQAVDSCRTAVGLYRGPLFEDDQAGEWYLPERRQLEELNLQALQYLAETYCERDQLSMAVEFGQHAVTIDPCYEAAHRLLMRCYGRQQQQQLVTRQYQLCVAALRDELGVSPAGETVRLFRSLTSTA